MSKENARKECSGCQYCESYNDCSTRRKTAKRREDLDRIDFMNFNQYGLDREVNEHLEGWVEIPELCFKDFCKDSFDKNTGRFYEYTE